MKRNLFFILCFFPFLMEASFPVTDEYFVSPEDNRYEVFNNDFANVSYYFGKIMYFIGSAGLFMRYAAGFHVHFMDLHVTDNTSQIKLLGEILLILASLYSCVSFFSGIAGLFSGKKRWQAIFGILLSIPGMIMTYLLIRYGFDLFDVRVKEAIIDIFNF